LCEPADKFTELVKSTAKTVMIVMFFIARFIVVPFLPSTEQLLPGLRPAGATTFLPEI
jgi:hypothetical protein